MSIKMFLFRLCVSAVLALSFSDLAFAGGLEAAAGLLRPDGTIDAARSGAASLDLRGWQVRLDAERGPVLTPAGEAAESWNSVGHGVGYESGGENYGEVYAIAVGSGNVYVGGYFIEICGNAACD